MEIVLEFLGLFLCKIEGDNIMKAREIAFKILCDIEENNNYSNIAINKHFKNLVWSC